MHHQSCRQPSTEILIAGSADMDGIELKMIGEDVDVFAAGSPAVVKKTFGDASVSVVKTKAGKADQMSVQCFVMQPCLKHRCVVQS